MTGSGDIAIARQRQRAAAALLWVISIEQTNDGPNPCGKVYSGEDNPYICINMYGSALEPLVMRLGKLYIDYALGLAESDLGQCPTPIDA